MALTANSQPSQTSHVESEQTLSARFQKLLTQLNTANTFVPEFIDGQWLALCVLGLIDVKNGQNVVRRGWMPLDTSSAAL